MAVGCWLWRQFDNQVSYKPRQFSTNPGSENTICLIEPLPLSQSQSSLKILFFSLFHSLYKSQVNKWFHTTYLPYLRHISSSLKHQDLWVYLFLKVSVQDVMYPTFEFIWFSQMQLYQIIYRGNNNVADTFVFFQWGSWLIRELLFFNH